MKNLRKALALILALAAIFCLPVGASAASMAGATIDTTRTGSLDIYKYDYTNAAQDGVWDGSYVSTGVRDESGVEAVLGDASRVSDLGNGETAYGYALKGVEFSYLKIADIATYTESENGASHVEVLYGMANTTKADALLAAMGLSSTNRYAPADKDGVYYYRSDTLIDGLASALTANATTVKNALETYVRENGGTALPETDEYGHTNASSLPLGLYLVVETAVPEMVTTTTAPFLVSLPMTSVNGSNATDGGTRWLYDVTLYPKNLTGIPSLEKTVREAKTDTGKNEGSAAITDGFAHTATASGGDVVEYQIVSTLPTITSEASYLTDYTFTDTLADGLRYNGDTKIEFFTDAACTDKIATWTPGDKFTASYTAHGMTIAMTTAGLNEINTSGAVYSSSVNSGYSDCTLRITYSATVNSDASVIYGDGGNPNAVTLRWQRSSNDYFDELHDDCHVYTYGIDLTKQFSDGQGDFAKVEFIAQNSTDGYYLTAALTDGVYYVTGHVNAESEATHFIPMDDGSLIIKGAEDDAYILTEVRTDNRYTLLRDDIHVTISTSESELCDCYTDTLGVTQNDSRYAHIQKHLEHKLLTASAAVDENAVTMLPDSESPNALAPLTVVNTRGYDLPQTGGHGNWIYPAIGITLMVIAGAMLLMMRKKK